MIIGMLTNLIKNKKKKKKTELAIEELKKSLIEDPKFRDEILRELEYRTGRRDILKAGVLGLLGLSAVASGRAYAQNVTSNMNIDENVVRELVSDYVKNYADSIKIPKPCTVVVAQDGTGDYDVSPREDASEVIQKAIDYAHRKGGGEVRIREGKYYVHNTIKIQKSDIVIEGAGWKTKIIGTDTNDVIFIDGINNYTRGIVIEGLHISGSGNGIKMVGKSPRVVTKTEIKNCYIENIRGHGISIGGTVYKIVVRDVTIHKVSGYGIYFYKYANDTPCINYFDNIEIITSNDAIRGVLRVSKLDSISTNNKIFIEAGYGNVLVNCHVESCPDIGIHVNQSHHKLIGCKVVNAGSDAFYINSKYTTLIGCFTFGKTGRYDLKVTGYSDELTIKGCNFKSYSINPKIVDPDIDFLNTFTNLTPNNGTLTIKFRCRFSKKPKVQVVLEQQAMWFVQSWIIDKEGYYTGCNIKFVDNRNEPVDLKCHVYITKF